MNLSPDLSALLKKFQQYGLNDQAPKDSFLLSFEGIEGSGKSTQIKLLESFLTQKGYTVLTLREPGGTTFGEGLRNAILGSDSPIHPLAEAHLFASSRAQLVSQKILPALAKDKTVVILDRYIDSSLSYQGNARGLGFETILNLHTHPPLNILPSMTFYLEISLETSMQRQDLRNNKKDYFEKENQDFYKKLINGFEKCCEVFPKRIKVINATNSIEQVQVEIQSAVSSLL